MQRRFFLPLLAAAVLATVLLGADRASGAIRITISDGTTDKVFYADGESAAFITDLGGFEAIVYATLTNYPGADDGGTLQQTIILEDTSSISGDTLPTYSFLSEVIEDVAGVSTGEVTGTSNLNAVLTADLARFELPSGTLLRATSDVSSSDATFQSETGTVQNITTVNGVAVPSLVIPVNSSTEADTFADVANNPAVGYTLTSEVILDGANVGTNLTIGADSAVIASPAQVDIIPEPMSAAVWGLGALGLAVAGGVRRRLLSGRK